MTEPIPPSAPGPRLRAARERAGLTQAAAAERMGVGQATWWQYETGRRPATLEWLLRAADAIGADPAELDGRLASRRGAGNGEPPSYQGV